MKFLLLIICFILSATAWTQEIHFFGSLDYAKTTTKKDVEYIGIKNKFGLSNLSTAGINVTGKVDDNTQALVQVIHAPQPNKIVVDLIQLQRTFEHEIKVRVGQQRLPTFLKSEVIQVKALYPWTNAPVEVYNQIPVKSFTGGSLEKAMGDFSIQAYFGDVKDEFFQGETQTNVAGHHLIGARLNYQKDNFEAYFNALKNDTDITIKTPVSIATNVSGTATIKETLKDLEAFTTGFSWDDQRWLVMSEYIRLQSKSSIIDKLDAAYASLGYHFTEKFLLLGTFSTEMTRISTSSPSKGTTYDATFQYAINMNTVIKLGASHVNYRRHESASTLSPTGVSDRGNGLTGSPGNNFNVYDVQLAFVF